MRNQKELSPEAKLLKLIKTGSGLKADPERLTGSGERYGISPVKNIFSHLNTLFSKFTPIALFKNRIRMSLIFVIAICLVYLCFSFYGRKETKLEMYVPQPVSNTNVNVTRPDDKLAVKPYSYYSEDIGKKELFGSSVSQAESQQGQASFVQASGDFNLIGIVWGDNPQAIIEDNKNQKTYFLNKGSFIGDYQVQEIEQGRVRLDLKGQKLDLFL